jgi:flavodoxin
MKAIVVYFSLDGNTEYTAKTISENLQIDTLRLEPYKDYPAGNFSKYFWGGKSVVFGEKPRLVPYHFNASDYETIIIGTPIWASSFTPPIKTFLGENDLSGKKIALFACGAGEAPEKLYSKFRQELPGSEIVATLSLIDPKNKPSEGNAKKISEFCNTIARIS